MFQLRKITLDAFLRDYIPVSVLAERLQTDPRRLCARLTKLSIFPVAGPKVPSSAAKVSIFRVADIVNLRPEDPFLSEKSDQGGRPRKGEKSRRAQLIDSLVSAVDAAQIIRCSTQELGKLVRSGLLTAADTNGASFSGKYFAREEIERHLKAFRENPELVSEEQAISLLGLSNKREFRMGWVKPKRLRVVDAALEKFFYREEIEKALGCLSRALNSRQIVSRFGVKRHEVNNAVKLGKLRPVSGPDVDGSEILDFDIEEVEMWAALRGKSAS